MTELVVIMAVMVPLFLLIPIIAKYQHAKHMAQLAARNAAWEATVSKNYQMPSNVQELMLDRSFSSSSAAIRTVPPATRGRFSSPMTNSFSNQPLFDRAGMTAWISESTPSGAAPVSSLIGKIPGIGNKWPPNKKGYVTAQVELNFNDLRTSDGRPARYLAPFDNLNLRMARKQVLLVDAWNASGGGGHGQLKDRRSVVSQVEGLPGPVGLLEPVSRVTDSISSMPGIDFLPVLSRFSKLRIGHVEPDIVPTDRLQHYPEN